MNRVGLIIAAFESVRRYQPSVQAGELDVRRIPHQGAGAEFYFAPDGKTLIGNAKLEGDEAHYVYTMRIEDGEMVKINGKGEDACSHFFPDGKRLIWTSTRDLTGSAQGWLFRSQ